MNNYEFYSNGKMSVLKPREQLLSSVLYRNGSLTLHNIDLIFLAVSKHTFIANFLSSMLFFMMSWRRFSTRPTRHMYFKFVYPLI